MNKVKPFFDYTVKLIELLEDPSGKNRDEKIKLIQEYLEKREQELQVIAAPFSEEESLLGKQLIQLNEKLAVLLEQEKGMIRQDIKELHAKKVSNRKYINPYENMNTGGVFYDKRK